MSLTIIQTCSMGGARLGRHVKGRWVAVVVGFLLCGQTTYAATLSEPVFDSPRSGEAQLAASTMITGSAEIGSDVILTVDGEAMGRVTLAPSQSTRASFAFTPPVPLAPGYHAVEAFATDPTGQKEAKQSLWWWFHVRDELPAPVIVQVHERKGNQLAVTGLVKSGYRVRLYVDNANIITSNPFIHASGTGNFSIYIGPFSVGEHSIRAALVSVDGREGSLSEPELVIVTGTVVQSPMNRGTRANDELHAIRLREEMNIATSTVAQVLAIGQSPSRVVPDTVSSEVVPDREDAPSSVLIVPATSTTTTTPAIVRQAEGQSTMSSDTSRKQIAALAVLGVLLLALIAWYTTRKESEGEIVASIAHQESGTPETLSINTSTGSIDAPSGMVEMDDKQFDDDVPFPTPPPPPAPNFNSRNDQW